MSLPTAKTAGYTTFRGRVACTCLAKWLPVYEAELLRRGLIKKNIDIWQLTGGAAASGGTHSRGGAADLAQVKTEEVFVARQMGADAAWHRPKNWDGRGGMEHHHLVLRGCPHNAPARYQYDSTRYGVDHGHNGLANGAKDTGPKPLSKRTWEQGIAWAKAQQPPPDPRPKAGAPWFKIATFNMKAPSLTRTGAHAWSKRRDAQVVSIDAIAADVLAVQEAGSGDDLAWLDKHLAPALSRVPGGGNWRHIYVSSLCEVVASGSFELTPLYKGDTKEAAWAVLKISNTHALVTSFHLEEDSAAAADPVRAKQIVSLYLQAAAVARDRGVDSSRIFHAGDANSVKLVAKTLAPLGFVPADVNARSTKNTLFATINNWVNKAKGGHSDYIFVPALRPVLSWWQKVNAVISDHNAVVCVIAAIA